MKKYLLTFIALLTFSVGSAHAVVDVPGLSFDGLYEQDLQLIEFEFVNNSENDVSIWLDTQKDGFDARGTLFVKNTMTGAWDWTGLKMTDAPQSDFDFSAGYNPTGVNDFGVALKNGFTLNDTNDLGVSDPGMTVENLAVGQYLFVVSNELHKSKAEIAFDNVTVSGTLDDGFQDSSFGGLFFPNWSTGDYYTGEASPFDVHITGDVSAVPVPAALWLFTSALLGLGFSSRKK